MTHILVVDAMKDGMSLRSGYKDFVTVVNEVSVEGCSIWRKPYDPIPLIVHNPEHVTEFAFGQILQVDDIERYNDYLKDNRGLYPHSIVLRNTVKKKHLPVDVVFFFSQREIPDITSGYEKVEGGRFTQEIVDELWDDIIEDRPWSR